MNRKNRLQVFFVAALGAVAMLALPAIAPAKHHDRSEKRHGHRGHRHGGTPAGTIQSFDTETGRLVISLPSEETIGGLVTDRTKIKCEDEHPATASSSRDGEEESTDDRGGHGEEPGDDHGEDGEEVGEDHGGDSSEPDSSPSGPSGHDDSGTGANCATADLIVGAVVQRAGLELEDGTATFDEVELAG